MRATSERERVNQRWSVRFFARPVHWHSATLSLSKINIEASPLPAHRQKNFERCSIRLLIDSRHPRNFRSNTRTRACSVERPLKKPAVGGKLSRWKRTFQNACTLFGSYRSIQVLSWTLSLYVCVSFIYKVR